MSTIVPTAPSAEGGSAEVGEDVSPRRPRPRHRVRLALVIAVIVGAVAFLLVEGLGSSLDYFDTVDQALAHKAALGTNDLRLEGMVVAGSIRSTALGTDFVISEGTSRVPVENTGSPSGLFQAGIPVVVVGHFASSASTTFLSNQIMVKHSAQYIATHPNRVKAANGTVH
jgi:cytochrome c-type biogenesis protein CcmE